MIQRILSSLEHEPRKLFRWVLAFGLLVLLGLNVVLSEPPPPPGGALRLELRSATASRIQVLFDTGRGFVAGPGSVRPVVVGTQTLDFPLPEVPVRRARIDPLAGPDTLNFHAIRVVRARDGREVRALDLESLTAPGTTQLTPNLEGLQVVTPPEADPPQLFLPLSHPITLAQTPAERFTSLLLVNGLACVAFYAVVFLAFFGWPPRPGFLPRREVLLGPLLRWFPSGWAGCFSRCLWPPPPEPWRCSRRIRTTWRPC